MSKYRNLVSKRSSPARFSGVALLMIFVLYFLFTRFSLTELVVYPGDSGHRAIESSETEPHFALRNEIEKSVHTSLRGDGKIYICRKQEAIRISIGEHSKAAV